MLHAGLDLSRRRLDYWLLDEAGDRLEVGAAPPNADGLRGFAHGVEERHGTVLVRAALESMNGARFVHDTLEQHDWEVEIADAQKVKGVGPLACKTDRIDASFQGRDVRADLALSALGGHPIGLGDGENRRADRLAQMQADREAHPGLAAIVEQLVRGAGRVAAHENLPVGRDLLRQL